MPTYNLQECREVEMYEAILKDIRNGDMMDEKDCDEILEIIEVEYRLGRISDEMVRYLTKVLCSQK